MTFYLVAAAIIFYLATHTNISRKQNRLTTKFIVSIKITKRSNFNLVWSRKVSSGAIDFTMGMSRKSTRKNHRGSSKFIVKK